VLVLPGPERRGSAPAGPGRWFWPPTQILAGNWASDFRCGGVKQAVSHPALGPAAAISGTHQRFWLFLTRRALRTLVHLIRLSGLSSIVQPHDRDPSSGTKGRPGRTTGNLVARTSAGP